MHNMTDVRVRFAPSPTGYLHVGGVRTALFNWLYARQQNGKFILRIEDTDVQRNKEEATQIILDGLKWCGLNWDEGPIFQSDRISRYKEVADDLVKSGKAYWAKKEPTGPIPSWRIEDLKKRGKWDEENTRAETDPSPALYLKIDLSGRSEIIFDDAVKGQLAKPSDTYSDFVIMRSNGMPVYNFACVVDDVDMKISHVIRGDDHAENTFRQLFIYEALNASVPVFAHLPMIFNEEKKKISKRRDPVAITLYQGCGLLPEAFLNFEALLGWGPGADRELMTIDEMVRDFSFDRIKTSSAQFTLCRKSPPPVPVGGATTDPGIEQQIVRWMGESLVGSKLEWMNSEYMKKLTPDALLEAARPFLVAEHYDLDKPVDWLKNVLVTEQSRSKTLRQLAENVRLFFWEPSIIDDKAAQKFLHENGLAILAEVRDVLALSTDWTSHGVETTLNGFCSLKGLKMGLVAQPIRVAIAGVAVSPPIHESLSLLGKNETLARIDKVPEHLKNQKRIAEIFSSLDHITGEDWKRLIEKNKELRIKYERDDD